MSYLPSSKRSLPRCWWAKASSSGTRGSSSMAALARDRITVEYRSSARSRSPFQCKAWARRIAALAESMGITPDRSSASGSPGPPRRPRTRQPTSHARAVSPSIRRRGTHSASPSSPAASSSESRARVAASSTGRSLRGWGSIRNDGSRRAERLRGRLRGRRPDVGGGALPPHQRPRREQSHQRIGGGATAEDQVRGAAQERHLLQGGDPVGGGEEVRHDLDGCEEAVDRDEEPAEEDRYEQHEHGVLDRLALGHERRDDQAHSQ